MSGAPFGVAVTPDGRYAFVDLTDGRVLVYSLAKSAPRLIRTIAVPDGALGCSLTRDGRLLLVADDEQGASVVDVDRAETGARDPLLGTLTPPASAHLGATGAIETATSRDGRYVFVSLEYGRPGGAIAIYDLDHERQPRFGSRDYVGSLTLGQAVVGSALSPDGRELYVTSELGAGGLKSDGTLSVINVARAEHRVPHAVLSTVAAGHQPVRVAVSPDGAAVWVTARADNELLAFSARRLLTRPDRARRASLKVGTAPVGVASFDHGARLIIANSDRYATPGAHATVTLVNASAALHHQPATIGTVTSGGFPREIAIDRGDDTALVSNFGSEQIEIVPLGRFH